MLKFTAKQLTAMGFNSHEEAAESISGLVAANSEQGKTILALRKDLDGALTFNGQLKSDLQAANGEIGTLKQAIAAVPNETTFKGWAKTEGSAAAVAAVSGVGMGAPVAPSPAPAVAPANAQFDALTKQGKHEEAFEFASESVRFEFMNAKTYAAFQRANHGGAVKLKTSN